MRTYTIKTLAHADQRYNTVGDYETKEDTTEIRVSDLQDPDMEFLIAIHELVESYLCQRDGVTDADIDAFDFTYEEGRTNPDAPGPGDDPLAPYHHQHVFATLIERTVAQELEVDWEEYEKKIATATASYHKRDTE